MDLLPKIELGRTGLRVSRLAFGTGTHGVGGHSDQSALGVRGLADLLLAGFNAGINFWDSADAYGTHPHIRQALKSVERDRVVVLTKTMSRDPARVTRDVDRYLQELGIDELDVVLLHFISRPDWPNHNRPAMEALSQAKEAGKVRAVGVSCHSLGALKAAVRSEWAEVVMARINFDGTQMDARPARTEPVLSALHAVGIGVVGMKVLGAGRLTREVKPALGYVLSLGSVHTVTIGMTNRHQLAENLDVMAQHR